MQLVTLAFQLKICVITAFGPTHFATSYIIICNEMYISYRDRYEARSESIRQIREISTIGINNYVDTIFTNEKCKDIHSTSI